MSQSVLASRSRRLLLPRLCLAALALAINAEVAAAELFTRPQGVCPELAGHFRVTGFSHALADALERLRIRHAGFTGMEVKLGGRAEEGLKIWVREAGTGMTESQPTVVLQHGSDFTCKDGQIIFTSSEGAERRIEQDWYQGKSTVSLHRGNPRGLSIVVTFTGRQRTTLYSYDSARISLPKWGTGKTLTEVIRWPDITEPYTPPKQAVAPPPEPKALISARRMLDSNLLGNVMLAGLAVSGDSVVATLNLRYSEDVVGLEDRLHAAAIPYKVKKSPRRSNNVYHMEILVWPEGGGPGDAWHPSVSRVEQEILRMGNPMVDVKKVDDVGDAYVATLNILGHEPAENIVARLRTTTSIFSEIALISESVRADQPKIRIAQLRLRVR